MAWHIEEAVIGGEIDNRTRGRVTGRLWLAGCPHPITLDLVGNAWRDLAGRRMIFTNPERPVQPLTPEQSAQFAAAQRGRVGDITASRREKIPDVPAEEVMRCLAAGKAYPWHWGNTLHLEWYDETNGRVVLESAKLLLTISPEVAWELTVEEEAAQKRSNAEAMSGHIEELAREFADKKPADSAADGDEESDPDRAPEGAAPSAGGNDGNGQGSKRAKGRGEESTAGNDDDDAGDGASWREIPPQTEEEAEIMQADNDRLADRIEARIRREGPDADYEKILSEELDRRAQERGEDPRTPEDEERHAEWVEAMNSIFDEALAEPDPEWEAQREMKHGVAVRAHDFALRVCELVDHSGLMAEALSSEHPAVELENGLQFAAAKLAGALNGREWPPNLHFCAGVIVRLKRAREYLDDALRALDSCQEQRLLPPADLGMIVVELADLAHAVDAIIADLRMRLARGWE